MQAGFGVNVLRKMFAMRKRMGEKKD